MEKKLKKKIRNMSLQQALIIVFISGVMGILILSSITIIIMTRVQREIIEKRSISIQLEEMEKKENGDIVYELEQQAQLTPFTSKQGILYYGSIILAILLPMVYVIGGLGLAAKIYYKYKLQEPMSILKSGIKNITYGDLDFYFKYESDDELGELCNAMEIMRQELRNDKKRIADLINDKKILNASMSHDLGTPITVIKGYIDYLRKGVSEDLITEDILLETLGYIGESANRLERYVQGVRNIQHLDDIELSLQSINFGLLYEELVSNIRILEERYNKTICLSTDIPKNERFLMDKQIVFRILENVLKNALRYASKKIKIECHMYGNLMGICVMDDGIGFSKKVIDAVSNSLFVTDDKEHHFGIGLSISRILCKKHGGGIEISNTNQLGGKVFFTIKVKD